MNEHTKRSLEYGRKLYLSWLDACGLDVAAVTTKDAQRYADHLRDQGYSAATIQSRISAASSFYPPSPFHGLTIPSPPDAIQAYRQHPPIAADAFDRLLRTSSGQEKLLFLLTGVDGLRIQEALSLQWDDLLVSTKYDWLSDETTAHARSLFDQKASSTQRLVFTTRHRSGAVNWLRKAGITGGFHQLRKLAATRWLDSGHSEHEIARRLGHTRTHNVTSVYIGV